MTYFAKVKNNIVQQVIVAEQDFIDTLPNPKEWYLTDIKSFEGVGYRANFAGIGYIYDEQYNVFYPPSPFPSWVLNKTTWEWEAPVPYPNDGKVYVWDEATESWILAPDDAI